MAYFATHPSLWGNLLLLTIPQLTLTVAVTALSFMFLYPPQAVLAFVLNGPAGIVGSVIGMFQQSMSITRCVSELFLFPKPFRILFDGVLVQEGMDRVILQARMSSPEKYDQSDYQRTISWAKSVPRKLIYPMWLVKVLVRFLLSFIPILGPIILVVLDASGTVERCLGRYFELKGWDKPHIDAFKRSHIVQWYSFGLVAATLEAMPFVGFTFAFSNTTAGALWAVSLEKKSYDAMAADNEKNKRRRRIVH